MACESYFKIKLNFTEIIKFWTPQRAAAAWAKQPLGTWESCILVSQMQYFHWFLKVLQNRACVPAMKKSPKGDFLHNNHHDNVI